MVRRLRGQKAAEYSQSSECPRERREIDQTQSDSNPRLLAKERLGSGSQIECCGCMGARRQRPTLAREAVLQMRYMGVPLISRGRK
jgi:hypothetical protein